MQKIIGDYCLFNKMLIYLTSFGIYRKNIDILLASIIFSSVYLMRRKKIKFELILSYAIKLLFQKIIFS